MLHLHRRSCWKQPRSLHSPGRLGPLAADVPQYMCTHGSHRCEAAAVGIDLGTTNSAVAIFREGDTYPSIVQDSAGAGIIPSVVAYDKQGSVIVGHAAKRQAVTNPLNTFYSVKRLIGQPHADVDHLQHVYRTRRAADGFVELSCPARSCHLAPQEVSAELLKHLLAMAAKETGKSSGRPKPSNWLDGSYVASCVFACLVGSFVGFFFHLSSTGTQGRAGEGKANRRWDLGLGTNPFKTGSASMADQRDEVRTCLPIINNAIKVIVLSCSQRLQCQECFLLLCMRSAAKELPLERKLDND